MSRAGPLNWGRLARTLAMGLAVLVAAAYVLGVGAAYAWLRYSRKLEAVQVTDVAFFRLAAIRRLQAAEQFAQAGEKWQAKEYQEAYVLFISAVRRDPANTAGRLQAAKFLEAMGATNLRINLLEEGLALQPENRELNEALFTQLAALGRHRRVLELLHGPQATALAGTNATFLRAAEFQATFAASGAPAAKLVLARYPELRQYPPAIPTVARVLWEAEDRAGAMQLLAGQVAAHPEVFAHYILLADYQGQSGQIDEALQTAVKAADRFPGNPIPRVLVLELGAGRIRGTAEWWKQIAFYLRDFQTSREAVFLLAGTAGRHGWLEVTTMLYELGATRGHDLGLLGLFHSDALLQAAQVTAARAILAQIEDQTTERNGPFLVQLRQREIAAAAAARDPEGVRESARRLAGLVRGDPDLFEQYRQFYQTAGLPEAVAEFSERKARPAGAPARRGS